MIILEANQGKSDKKIAHRLHVSPPTIRLWKRRFTEGGPQALTEIAAGRGRKPAYGPRKVAAIVKATQQTKPPGQTHWSCRSMAKSQKVSFKTVQRISNLH